MNKCEYCNTEADHETNDVICLIRQAVNDRDREWFQIIESILDFHPVSMTEALNKGLEKVRKLKNPSRLSSWINMHKRDKKDE